MPKENSTLLERLAEASFPLNLLFDAKHDQAIAPIANLILASSAILDRSKKEWIYKSLAELGEEIFITSSHSNWANNAGQWIKPAISVFSECVYRQVWYEEDEGLVFYVLQEGKFRPAVQGDAAYDFVCRLRQDTSLSDLHFAKPPSWAFELYLYKPNYDAYRVIWYSNNFKIDDPKYKDAQKAKAEAVRNETKRLAGLINAENDSSTPSKSKPLSTTERHTFLTIIAALCDYAAIGFAERGASVQIAKLTQDIGAAISDDTIRPLLKQIPEALGRRTK